MCLLSGMQAARVWEEPPNPPLRQETEEPLAEQQEPTRCGQTRRDDDDSRREEKQPCPD